MSIWTEVKGTVKIRKSDKISIREIVNQVYTDEFAIKLNTIEKDSFYIHDFELSMCIDGENFINNWKTFIEKLKAVTYDFHCGLRLGGVESDRFYY